MAKASVKQTRKKQPAKAKAQTKVAAKPPAKKAAPASQPQPQTKTGGMWKLLELKEQRLKLANQGQQKRTTTSNGRNQFTIQNDHFSKFSGPRRRAA